VEKWDLENFPKTPTPENIPSREHSTRVQVGRLVAWLVNEITAVYFPDEKEEDDPNA
jgi:hypothetical protein